MITRELVLAWLDTFDDEDVVGVSNTFGHCPFAEMLSEVNNTHIEISGTGLIYPSMEQSPAWVIQVIHKVDFGGEVDRKITAKEFREYVLEVTD